MQALPTPPRSGPTAPIFAFTHLVRRDPATPTLADILADPITRAIMSADHVSAVDLVALCRTVRSRLLAA